MDVLITYNTWQPECRSSQPQPHDQMSPRTCKHCPILLTQHLHWTVCFVQSHCSLDLFLNEKKFYPTCAKMFEVVYLRVTFKTSGRSNKQFRVAWLGFLFSLERSLPRNYIHVHSFCARSTLEGYSVTANQLPLCGVPTQRYLTHLCHQKRCWCMGYAVVQQASS